MAIVRRNRLSRRAFVTGTGAAGLAALAGCATQSGGDGSGGDSTEETGLSGSIAIAGSSTVFPLATQMKQAFQENHPDVTISVQSTGSGGGFQNHFCTGDIDFNNASRPIKDAEQQLCSDNGVEWVELKVATDALTVVVNNDNDWVDCLTVEELKQLWVAEGATKWSDVNSDGPTRRSTASARPRHPARSITSTRRSSARKPSTLRTSKPPSRTGPSSRASKTTSTPSVTSGSRSSSTTRTPSGGSRSTTVTAACRQLSRTRRTASIPRCRDPFSPTPRSPRSRTNNRSGSSPSSS